MLLSAVFPGPVHAGRPALLGAANSNTDLQRARRLDRRDHGNGIVALHQLSAVAFRSICSSMLKTAA